ncbi:MAG: hypothetical protein WCA07_04410 [Gloeobacterales cyanobacterium]
MTKGSIYHTSIGFFGAFVAFLGINALVYTQLTPPISDIGLLPESSPVKKELAIAVEGRILSGAGSVSGLTCSEVEVSIMSVGVTGGDTVDTVRATSRNLRAGCVFSLSGAAKYAGKNLILSGKVLGEAGRTYNIQDKVLNIPEGSTLKVNLYLDAPSQT